jgi:ParB family chromosome partitioning protein
MSFQGDSIYWVEVEKIVPNPFQPRREFDEERLQELADSIRMYGVLQPLTVTRKEVQREDGTFYSEYELIAGERRLRASKLAGVSQVPVIIRDGEQSEQEKLELAIIENLQREDLNAVDRALAFRQLADVFGLQHTQVAKKVGRSREYVSNSIRLLNLPEHILSALRQADISEGHARTLLMLNDRPEEQDVVFREILLKKLSVREVERIARNIATEKVRAKTLESMDATLIEMEKQFTETLGTRVQIQKTDFGGKLTIDYFSVEDLEAILERMRAEAVADRSLVAAQVSERTPLQIEDVPTYEATPTPSVVLPDPGESSLAQSPVVTVGVEPVQPPVASTPVPTTVPTPAAPVDEIVTIASAAPVTPTASTPAVANQAPVSTPPVSPLAAALSRALGRPMGQVANGGAALVASTTPTAVPAQSTPTPAASVQTPSPTVTPTPVSAEDESDIYSIKHFTI